MSAPKVSIIVPVYKVEQYLMQCIASIRHQTLHDIEIILVDEGDNDACFAIMRHQQSQDERIKIIHERCGGYGAACNKGINAATGEYTSIVESDDFIEPTMLDEMYREAKQYDLDVLKTPFYMYWDKTAASPARKEFCSYKEKIARTAPAGPFKILDFPQQMAVHASVWSGIYKTAFLNRNSIHFVSAKGAGYVDVLFRIRTLLEADKIGWLDREFYNYRVTNASSSTNNFDLTAMLMRWAEAHAYFVEKDPGIYRVVGPYLIMDEYLNTFAFCSRNVSPKQFELVKENLSHIDRGLVEKSPELSRRQKEEIFGLMASKSPSQFRRQNFSLRRQFMRYIRFEMMFRHNFLKLHLLPDWGATIFKFQFDFFGKFKLYIIVGTVQTYRTKAFSECQDQVFQS